MREGAEADHVFLDRSGRRRRFLKIVGAGVATSLVTILLLLAAALSGVSPVDLPGLPHAAGHAGPTARPSASDVVHPVDTRSGVVQPLPSPSATPAATPTPSPTRRHGQPSRSPHPTRTK